MWIPIAAVIEGKGTVKGLNSCERDEKGIKMSALITCNHVDFGYENHDAVVDLTMEVDSGDYLCVVGENGSGKSTLMKGLLGLITDCGRRTEKDRDRLSAPADGGPEGFSGDRL